MKAGGIAARLRSAPAAGAVLAVLTVLGLVVPSTASAASTSFSCRASALRISNLPLNLTPKPIEPFVANGADTPCRDDSENLIGTTSLAGGVLTVNAINVATKVINTGWNAASTVTNPTINLGNGSLVIHADVVDAAAGYECVNGAAKAVTSGHVVNLVINGKAITIPPGVNQTYTVGPFKLTLNEIDTTTTSVMRRAVDLVTPLGTVVLSEAIADMTGNPCASSSQLTKGTGTGHLVVTPKGAARLIASHRCVSNTFKATVEGREISKVSFTLDGRSDGTRTHSPFGVTIHPKSGSHTLKARVTFNSSSGTPPKTLTLRFKGCSGGHARIVITPKAAARLIAAHRCVRNAFHATVVGTGISKVVFSEDGAPLGTITRKPYRVTIQPTPGHHSLTARVTFKRSSHTKPRTLRVGFTGCPAPNFTG